MRQHFCLFKIKFPNLKDKILLILKFLYQDYPHIRITSTDLTQYFFFIPSSGKHLLSLSTVNEFVGFY
jgi:hypothetical protein